MFFSIVLLSLSMLVSNGQSYDCVIIGSGPAGLAAALYTVQANISTAVIAQDFGQLTGSHRVENFPGVAGKSGTEIIETIWDQIQGSGTIDFFDDTVIAIDFSYRPDQCFKIMTAQNGVIEAKTVIIATGSSPKRLGVPGEDQLWGFGVSSCAVCDGFLYKNKEVIVVGGGNSAIEQALQLIGYAKKVTIVVRKSEMRATPHEKKKLYEHSEKIKVIYDTVVTEILGDISTGVTGIQVVNKVDGSVSMVPTDGIFLAIGHNPNTALFKEWLPLDETGHIVLTTRSQMTNIPGIFVAGDVAEAHFKQAPKAIGDGVQAALEAIDFVRFRN